MAPAGVLDAHIHLMGGDGAPADFAVRRATAGVDGGVVISLPPPCFGTARGSRGSAQRLDHVLQWCAGSELLFPFYWVDPLEADAAAQVDSAARAGVAGFKVICDHFPPGEPHALEVYRAIAAANLPLLFHAGILWDGKPSSGFNRPGEFEALLAVPGLRFALAHMAWPWIDELIAVYGKFQNACTEHGADVHMHIDTTPGTPPIYRREALSRLFTVGYAVRDRVMFGSDSLAEDYNPDWTASWLRRDRRILQDLGLDAAVADAVFGGNLLRFLGRATLPAPPAPLRPGA